MTEICEILLRRSILEYFDHFETYLGFGGWSLGVDEGGFGDVVGDFIAMPALRSWTRDVDAGALNAGLAAAGESTVGLYGYPRSISSLQLELARAILQRSRGGWRWCEWVPLVFVLSKKPFEITGPIPLNGSHNSFRESL